MLSRDKTIELTQEEFLNFIKDCQYEISENEIEKVKRLIKELATLTTRFKKGKTFKWCVYKGIDINGQYFYIVFQVVYVVWDINYAPTYGISGILYQGRDEFKAQEMYNNLCIEE